MDTSLLARRARPLVPVTLAMLLLTGCGTHSRSTDDDSVTVERLPAGVDTAGLSHGGPIVESFDVVRLPGGALLVRGHTTLPDHTRLQVTMKDAGTGRTLHVTQMQVANHAYESVPMVGDNGPFPVADYRFEVLSHFTREWQTADVLRQTGDGMNLRGPGITRSKVNGAALFLVEELHR